MEEYKIGQYSHCRSSFYKKKLFQRMKQKKQISIQNYGVFVWDETLWKHIEFNN